MQNQTEMLANKRTKKEIRGIRYRVHALTKRQTGKTVRSVQQQSVVNKFYEKNTL